MMQDHHRLDHRLTIDMHPLLRRIQRARIREYLPLHLSKDRVIFHHHPCVHLGHMLFRHLLQTRHQGQRCPRPHARQAHLRLFVVALPPRLLHSLQCRRRRLPRQLLPNIHRGIGVTSQNLSKVSTKYYSQNLKTSRRLRPSVLEMTWSAA